jgi:predicted ATPase
MQAAKLNGFAARPRSDALMRDAVSGDQLPSAASLLAPSREAGHHVGPLSGPRPSFVGRVRERRAFRECLDAALEGRGSLVLLGGEAGIGKTALAREFAAEAQRRGLLVLTGHCYDLTATPPYGPWLDLAARYRAGDGLPSLPDALRMDGIERSTSRPALFAEIEGFLANLSTSRPTVLVLEDLHWSDPASIELFRHIARGLVALPLIVVVTYRVDELRRDQPFARHLPALVRETVCVRLDLQPLDSVELRQLVVDRCTLAPEDERRLVSYLERRAEGNPFYVAELFRMLEEQGLLCQTDGKWTLESLDGAPVPTLLRQVIDDRVSRLGEEVRHPLEVAAIIGQEVPLDLWATVASIGGEDVLTIVEQAIAAHLFEPSSDDSRIRFVHALTREALYEGIAPPRRRLWHQQVAEALADAGTASADAIASHFQLAGDPRAPDWLVRAGERAQRAYAWSTAVERLVAAAELLAHLPEQEALRASLLYRCGRLQRYPRPVQGIEYLAAAEALAVAIGDHTLAAGARYSQGLLHCYADDFRRGLIDMTAGIEALEALPVDQGRSEAAIWFADALPTRAPAEQQTGVAADAFMHAHGFHHRRGGLPWFLAVPGRLAEAQAIGEACVALAQEAPPPGILLLADTAHAHHGLGITHAALG